VEEGRVEQTRSNGRENGGGAEGRGREACDTEAVPGWSLSKKGITPEDGRAGSRNWIPEVRGTP